MNVIYEGVNSIIMQGTNTNKVTKITRTRPNKEIKIQKIAVKAGLAPRVRSNIKNYGNIFKPFRYGYNMNKLPNNAISLKNHIKNNKNNRNNTINKIKEARNKLTSLRIFHGDLHPENIFVQIEEGKIKKVWIIDFGRSMILPNFAKNSTEFLKRGGIKKTKFGNHLYFRKKITPIFNNSKILDILGGKKIILV
jgi:tRNA A-37 threonylcarbamoyl transferase component Bud32